MSPERGNLDPELRRFLRAMLFFVACAAVFVILLLVGLYH